MPECSTAVRELRRSDGFCRSGGFAALPFGRFCSTAVRELRRSERVQPTAQAVGNQATNKPAPKGRKKKVAQMREHLRSRTNSALRTMASSWRSNTSWSSFLPPRCGLGSPATYPRREPWESKPTEPTPAERKDSGAPKERESAAHGASRGRANRQSLAPAERKDSGAPKERESAAHGASRGDSETIRPSPGGA